MDASDSERQNYIGEDGTLGLPEPNTPRRIPTPSPHTERGTPKHPKPIPTSPTAEEVDKSNTTPSKPIATPTQVVIQSPTPAAHHQFARVAYNKSAPSGHAANLSTDSPIQPVTIPANFFNPPAADGPTTTPSLLTLDRAFWSRRLRNPNEGGLFTSKIIRALGLRREKGGNRKVLAFGNNNVRQLVNAIRQHAERFPSSMEEMLDIAADPNTFAESVKSLISSFGSLIWVPDEQCAWLLPDAPQYTDKEDLVLLKKYLRLWIVVEAFNKHIYTKGNKTGELAKPDASLEKSTISASDVMSYDCAFWIRRLEDPNCPPSVESIVASLGIEYYNSGNNGTESSVNVDVEELKQYISDLANTLPHDKDALLEIAVTPEQLTGEVEKLLRQFGHKIWGRSSKWPPASQGSKESTKTLEYENTLDQVIIRSHLRLWILVQAMDSLTDHEQEEPMAIDEPTTGVNILSPDEPDTTTSSQQEFDATASPPLALEQTQAPADAAMESELRYNVGEALLRSPSPVRAGSRMTLDNDDGLQHDHPISPPDEHVDSANERASVLGVPATTEHSTQLLEPPLGCVSSTDEDKMQDNGCGLLPNTKASPNVPFVTAASAGAQRSRPTRAIRKAVPTYNVAILTGTGKHTPVKYLEKHHKNVLHGPIADATKIKPQYDSARPKTLSAIDRRLPPTEYWSEKSWKPFLKSNVVTLSTLISRLGLTFYNLRSKRRVRVHHPAGEQLLDEVFTIASLLYTQLSADQLVQAAADSSFLNEDIDLLLEEYAPSIWAVDADRSNLLQAGELELYPKDLVYEDDDDRKLLWLHIHQFIFIKAFHDLRKFGDSEKGRAAALYRLPGPSLGSVVPCRTYTVAPPDEQSQPKPSDASKPKKKKQNPRKREASEGTKNQPEPRPSKKQRPLNPLVATILKYLENKDDALKDQLLSEIDKELNDLKESTPPQADPHTSPNVYMAIMTAWVVFRRNIYAVEHRVSALSNSTQGQVRDKIERSRLLTELRRAWAEYNEVNPVSEESNEYALLTPLREWLRDDTEEWQSTVGEVWAGLTRLHDEFLELAKGLGNLEWVLMGADADR